MKIRIKGNSVRLRLTQTEVQTFADTGRVEEKTHFAPAKIFTYRLKVGTQSDIAADFSEDTITVFVPKAAAKNWAKSEAISLSHTVAAADGNDLRILVEKDFSCLVKREGEDDADAFPHPKV